MLKVFYLEIFPTVFEVHGYQYLQNEAQHSLLVRPDEGDGIKDVQSAAIMLGNAATRGLSSASSKFSMGNTNYQSTDYNALSQVFTKALEKGKFSIDRNGTMKFVESTMRRLYV